MPPGKLRLAARSALSRICLANAVEPAVIALHDRSELGPLKDDVASRFAGLTVADQNDDGLMRVIDEACRGDRLPNYRRGPSRYLGRGAVPVASPGEGLTTVVNGGAIGRLIDRRDLDAIFGPLLLTGLASCTIPPGGAAERALMDRSAAARTKRRLRLAGGELLGNPVLWAARTSLIDSVVDAADASGGNRAEAVTDVLGLLYPKFSKTDAAPNQRWALHLPASLLPRLTGFRPTFVEAGGYARFKARPLDGPPPAGWGATLDLGRLAAGTGMWDGLSELTLWPLTAASFVAGETIELEFLGAITESRGEDKGVDCDDTVAGLLTSGRTVAQLLRATR